MTAAAAALSPERMLELHNRPAARVERLIERGRAEGAFRTDLSIGWLVGIMHRIMHGAAADIEAGTLAPHDAAATISATILAAYTAPGEAVPPAELWESR
jgi:hypothetical protein